MRKLFTFLAAVLLTANVFAQSPDKMSYQAVIRNSSDQLVTNQAIGMQISILQGSASGTAVYVETQTPTTNTNGLVSIEIGAGTVVNGDFTTIDWANGPYFIKTETDPTQAGGTNYTITGVSQLLSVPYALHAKTADTLTGAITESDPTVPAHVKAITTTDITNWNSKYEVGDAIDASSISVGGQMVVDIHGNLVGPAVNHSHDASNIVTGVLDIFRIPVGTTASTVAAGDHDHIASHITAGVFPVERGGTGQIVLTPGSFLIGNGTNAVTLRTPAQVRTDIGAAAEIHTHSLASVLGENNNAVGNQIKNLADPTDDQDAATKAYVDELEAKLNLLETALIDAGIHPSKFKDERDGNIYNYVTIGNQTWMAENLKYLPSVVGPGTGSQTIPHYYVYGYNGTDTSLAKATAYYTTYGVLYNWPAAMNSSASSSSNPSGVQGVCPTGWHLPSDAEWTELTNFVGGLNNAGTKLKSTSGWSSGGNGTDEFGFTALPGSLRMSNGSFSSIGSSGFWWSATMYNYGPWHRNMTNTTNAVLWSTTDEDLGFSVRCIRD